MNKNGIILLIVLCLFFSCSNDPEGSRTNIGSQRPATHELPAPADDHSNKKLRESYDDDRLKDILQSARNSIFRFWNDGKTPVLPEQGPNEGLAIRLIVQGKDRGCLAWFKNCGDMNLFAEFCAVQALMDPRYKPVRPDEAEKTLMELTIFGDWEAMQNPEDFIPGYHNLWLIDGINNTILQASLVPERNYSKEDFLQHICTKAGLAKGAWKKNAALTWQRSPGLWLAEPLINEPF